MTCPNSTETMDRNFVTSSKTKSAQTQVACELACVQVAVATRHGSNTSVPTSTEIRVRPRSRLGTKKWTSEPRERVSTKVSVESNPCVPCRLPPSGSQLVSISGLGTRTGVQRPTVGFQARVRVRTFAFFPPVISGRSPLFQRFSFPLEEIAHGSFSGLIVIPPISTWSRARNSGVRRPPP